MGALGGDKIILVLLLVLILFGGQKIPEMMRGLGQGMKEFKKATRDDDDERALPTSTSTTTTTPVDKT
ncbi:MAG: twin-arginine translocase TatA/TatE family subunit [Abitibacteriaceae bacterium]|nr:twin-arginine translocase TatA/TatE family subunit [Abditibacteriaceae bacterium]